MIENIIIVLIFIGALAYLGNMVRTQFSAKNAGCAKGCGSACKTAIKFDLPENM